MMEYAVFEFKPFGVDKTVSNLEDLYTFTDRELDSTSFSDVIPVCLRDVNKCAKSSTWHECFALRFETY